MKTPRFSSEFHHDTHSREHGAARVRDLAEKIAVIVRRIGHRLALRREIRVDRRHGIGRAVDRPVEGDGSVGSPERNLRVQAVAAPLFHANVHHRTQRVGPIRRKSPRVEVDRAHKVWIQSTSLLRAFHTRPFTVPRCAPRGSIVVSKSVRKKSLIRIEGVCVGVKCGRSVRRFTKNPLVQRCTRGSFGDFSVLTAVSRTADSTFIGCEGSYIYRNDQTRPLDKSFNIGSD